MTRSRLASRWISALLWLLAFALMVGVAAYQRRTGPTHPMSGTARVPGEAEVAWSFLRSETTGIGAPVRIPDPGPDVAATLVWRRYPSEDPFSRVEMASVEGERVARLPTQPPAGKVEYHVELASPGTPPVQLPPGEDVVLRYKGAVPTAVLVPHVLAMFLALVVGMRTILQALRSGRGLSRLAWATVVLLGLGGLLLGPLVQWYAFGAFWTGWPLGGDLTDTKTLLMFGGWLVAAFALGRTQEAGWGRRALVLGAGGVTLAVYLIPHSLRGSTLDYSRTDAGEAPAAAITTGR